MYFFSVLASVGAALNGGKSRHIGIVGMSYVSPRGYIHFIEVNTFYHPTHRLPHKKLHGSRQEVG